MRTIAVRGVAVRVLSGGTGLAIQIIATVVLARLLTPTDFGLVAMVSMFSLLLVNFGLNGFTEAILQCDELDRGLASNLFWINSLSSLALAAAFAASSILLEHLYKDPQVVSVAHVMSCTIFMSGLSVVHLALLKRGMRFGVVSAIDISSRCASVLVSVLLGAAGYGYWALVAGALAQSATVCIGAWVSCHWVPSLPRRGLGTRAMINFAVSTYSRFCTGYVCNNLDNFLVGWRIGPTTLGFYKKAYDLFVLPSGQLSSGLTEVAISIMSRLRRDTEQYCRYFLSAFGMMAFIGMAISGVLTLTGKDVIFLLLGPKWAVSGEIFTLFGPGIGVMLLYGTHNWLHLSLGRADRWFRWGLVDLVVTALLLCLGLHWGAHGVAVAWVAMYWTITFPAIWYAGRPIQLGLAPVIGGVWRYMLAALVAGVATASTRHFTPPLLGASGPSWALARIFITTILFGVIYLVLVILLHGGLTPINQLASLLGELRGRRGGADSTAGAETEGVYGEGSTTEGSPSLPSPMGEGW